jgi:primosomal protein N' (replication factor Y)
MPIPSHCFNCNGVNLRSIGTGIQKIYEEISKNFPTAKIIRVDSDTTSAKNAHQEVYEAIKNKEYDIVIGTQMIATGLDISGLSLVGVTNADIALNMPDFRSSERGFQLLTQVAGRTGRELKPGKVVIQTFNPEHPVIQAVQNHDIISFYNSELNFRKEFKYPPFNKLTKLTFSNSKPEKVKTEVKKVESVLNSLNVKYRSAPALIEKKHNKFYHHILIESLQPEKIIFKLNLTPDWWVDRDPINTI